MRLKVVDAATQKSVFISEGTNTTIPRQGELLTWDDRTWVVHNVTHHYELDAKCDVTVSASDLNRDR